MNNCCPFTEKSQVMDRKIQELFLVKQYRSKEMFSDTTV